MKQLVSHCGIVVLAGGQSSRLGRPKQLLPFKGTTLLRHTVEVALQSGCGPVVVVTGAEQELVTASLNGLDATLVHNAAWHEGMASSLRIGLGAVQQHYPLVDGIIFMVCDQPFVNKSVLLCLIDTQRKSGKGITASEYEGKTGTPALFHKTYFEKLLQLKGDKGARGLIAAYPEDTEVVPFAEGITDVDTEEDYKRLLH